MADRVRFTAPQFEGATICHDRGDQLLIKFPPPWNDYDLVDRMVIAALIWGATADTSQWRGCVGTN